ncbi:uncharacterized protein TNCV_3098891 [Trichonephila clavipes]|nr:uncharacterized protein TNCV_3098891 [Trichonephila clavipes]
MGFRRRRLTRVLLLTAGHKALHLVWARQHRHWTVDDWKHVACWRDMGPLIRLDTTLTEDGYLNILSDQLHPFMSIVISDGLGENFSSTMRHPTRPELLQSGYRSTLLDLDTSAGHQNLQT